MSRKVASFSSGNYFQFWRGRGGGNQVHWSCWERIWRILWRLRCSEYYSLFWRRVGKKFGRKSWVKKVWEQQDEGCKFLCKIGNRLHECRPDNRASNLNFVRLPKKYNEMASSQLIVVCCICVANLYLFCLFVFILPCCICVNGFLKEFPYGLFNRFPNGLP